MFYHLRREDMSVKYKNSLCGLEEYSHEIKLKDIRPIKIPYGRRSEQNSIRIELIVIPLIKKCKTT